MLKGRRRDYFCNLVSENVKLTLVNKRSIGIKYKKELCVKCDQSDCQYVDANLSPCPLTLDLFADEIAQREEKHRNR